MRDHAHEARHVQGARWLERWGLVGGALLALFLIGTLATSLLGRHIAYAEGASSAASGVSTTQTGRPSTTGQLSVTGTKLTDGQGEPVVLRGVSTHGLQWYPAYVNDELFAQLSDEWDCNLVRLALYSEDYCTGNEAANLQVLHAGIDACMAHDMYVLVDWHILDDANPLEHLDEAKGFFEAIASEYANVPNVLYEICNEPNGETSWSDVYAYASEVIPIIRAQSPDAVIIVGTTTYDRDLIMASRHPLPFDDVMYTLHFYASTHGDDLRGELTAALDAGLPVFVTECGLSEASGDGAVDFESTVAWFELLAEHDISYAIWSLSNKSETSAFIASSSSATTYLSDKDLTPVGLWVRALIQGQDPAQIPLPNLDADGQLVDTTPEWMQGLSDRDLRSVDSWPRFASMALAFMLLSIAIHLIQRGVERRHHHTYDDLPKTNEELAASKPQGLYPLTRQALIVLSALLTLIYLLWRVFYSMPIAYGWVPVAANVALLIVEMLGFVESLVHYRAISDIRNHPLPQIADEEYPEVDIFIATYNEPVDLLYRTINGCNHLRYPDRDKVHVWVCDDNRRPEMRELAESMGAGYFDRPDNKGAKAGNLNHALALTSAPYVVTLDADMIVRSDFLLKTIPYFVDAEKRCAGLPEQDRIRLGLLQTPQAFFDPDVFQHALYSENSTTNEQDYFYRTIEVAKTASNSVIYGGSNTVLSRAALEAIGGFYTESITEDFATGLLIESAGFVSLGLGEPLASGRTPHTFREHVQQRTRWARGVIVTGRKLHVLTRRGLTIDQKMSYWSSMVYWYSPLKNLIYLMSPLMFAVFGIPVFECSWLDLLVYWLPMFAAQTICLRVMSGNAVSSRWSGIHETSVMPFLLIPVIKETFGMTLSTFKVTDKTAGQGRHTVDTRAMAPFLVLLALSIVGIVRVCTLLSGPYPIGLVPLLFWLVRNAYYLLMAIFLVDGRDSDGEVVKVYEAEPVYVTQTYADGTQTTYEGVVTYLTEHSMRVFLDDANDLGIGERVSVSLVTDDYRADLAGSVVALARSRSGDATVHTIEILDYGTSQPAYLQILYDRVPSLPQTLRNDFGTLGHLWRNVAFHAAGTVR